MKCIALTSVETLASIIIRLLALQVCLGLCACSRKSPSPPTRSAPPSSRPAAARAPAREPSLLRLQVEHLATQLNPYVSPDVWSQRLLIPAVLEPLVQLSSAGAVVPHLASEVEARDGGRRFRLRLRPNLRFHDGRPLTSTDVKFTLDRLIARNAPLDTLKVELSDLEEVHALEPDLVELALRRPNHLILAVLAEIGILPAHLHGRFGLRNPKLNWIPVGSGPFQVIERRSRDQLLLEANPRYWGQAPGLQRILVVAIPDADRALAALRNGEVDLIPALHPGYYPDQISDARLKARFRSLRLHPYRLRLLLPNHRHPILRDRRVRAALDHLLDRERMMREQRHGLAQPLTAPFWVLSSWYDRALHPVSFDGKAAARLLDQAGWRELKPGAVRQRAGTPLRLKLLRSRESGEMQEAARVLQADLRGAGIELVVETGDFGFIRAQLKRGRFELALLGLAPRPEADLSPLLHSRGELNYGGYSNPMADALLDALRLAATAPDRARLARRLHRVLHEDPPYLLLYAPIDLMLASRRLKGLPQSGRWPRLAPLSF